MSDVAKGLAKDVAKQLEARARRRKLVWFALWAAAIVAAVLYLRCGRGWGLGGGDGDGHGGSGAGSTRTAGGSAVTPCRLRVDASGISVDDRKLDRDAAVIACGKAGGATVTITGDAREGDWDALRAALDAAHVSFSVQQRAP